MSEIPSTPAAVSQSFPVGKKPGFLAKLARAWTRAEQTDREVVAALGIGLLGGLVGVVIGAIIGAYTPGTTTLEYVGYSAFVGLLGVVAFMFCALLIWVAKMMTNGILTAYHNAGAELDREFEQTRR